MDFWSNELFERANQVVWDVLVFVSLALMVGLYSRVVYTLWFKRNDRLTHQQQVSTN